MKPTLPTNYKDDILNTSVEGMRRYQMIYNSDNTVSFKDVTPYDQTGSDFGAGDINLTNQAVNQSADAGKIIDDPDTAEATTEEGYIAGVQLFNHVNDSLASGQISFSVIDGEPYVKVGADSPRPFKSGVAELPFSLMPFRNNANSSITLTGKAVLSSVMSFDFSHINLLQIYALRHNTSTSGTLYVSIDDEPLTTLSQMQASENYHSFTLSKADTNYTKPTTPHVIDTSNLHEKKYIHLYANSDVGGLYFYDLVLN